MQSNTSFKMAFESPIKVHFCKPQEGTSFQSWTKIKSIEDGKVVLNDKEVVILKVLPINFKLKSSLEQKSILYEYQNFLKNINSKIQILISSQKTDVSNHIGEVLKVTKENPQLYEVSSDYTNLINRIVQDKRTITKSFYIIIESNPNIQNEISKTIEYLSNCGNEVEMCNKEEIKSLIMNFTNKRMQNLAL